MKRVLIPVACGAVLAVLAVVSPVKGQSPPPPPTVGGIPPPPGPPCPPGCPTATPTNTPVPTDTPTPTSTPTNTPIPLFVQVKLAHKTLKVGGKQKVTVTTLPAAHVTIQVAFPNKTKKHHGGTADDSGGFTWSFKQPGGVTTASSRTVKVTVTASNGTDSLKASKKYTIS
jgi:hypothetical protein